jgi:protein TonB
LAQGSVIRDQQRMPFAFVKPIYPPDANERGIEGWVDLKFTVTKNGSVKDPSVIKADPPSVFNRAAIDAVKKWKYRPKVVDGKAVEEHNVKAHVVFNLNDP